MTAARLTAQAARIPLTVIGGFLGAGKTTLLNRILTCAGGLRIAVLVNDFGAVNIDASLVRSSEADTISLANGCVCCQIGDDLTDALLRVTARQPRPDWIVIEASGVSDPWRIAQVGLVDPELTLDGVVVLVDATAVRAQAEDARLGDAIGRQLHAADLLILNKTDGLSARQCASIEHWLSVKAGRAPIFRTVHADVPMAVLTGLAIGGGHHAHRCEGRDAGGPCACLPADHGAQFDSWLFEDDTAVFEVDALRKWLKALPPHVLRIKGYLRVRAASGELETVELQFAGKHGSVRRLGAGEQPTALVAIGLRGVLPFGLLASTLPACRADAAGPNDGQALALPVARHAA